MPEKAKNVLATVLHRDHGKRSPAQRFGWVGQASLMVAERAEAGARGQLARVHDSELISITVLGQRIPIPPRPVLEPPAPEPEPEPSSPPPF